MSTTTQHPRRLSLPQRNIPYAPNANRPKFKMIVRATLIEVVHRFFKDGVFVRHTRRIRSPSRIRSLEKLLFSRKPVPARYSGREADLSYRLKIPCRSILARTNVPRTPWCRSWRCHRSAGRCLRAPLLLPPQTPLSICSACAQHSPSSS
jgi:hypothetical protein